MIRPEPVLQGLDLALGRVSDVVLRPYQDRALAHILACKDRGMDRVIVVMPTGTGKTTLFSALVGEFNRSFGHSSLILAHRQELLDQAMRRIGQQNPGLTVEIESGKARLETLPNAIVAGVQSLGRGTTTRLKGFEPGMMIVDEAHHAAADSYQNVMRRFGCYEGRCFTVGVTATPHRMDNKPLHGDEEAIFQEVAFSYSLREAIKDGWLADLRGYRVATGVDLSKVRRSHGDYNAKQLQDAVNTEARNEAAFSYWTDVAHDRRTIVFCTGVEHAKDVAELFRSQGIAAESVDGTMKPLERQGVMSRFAAGRTQVLTNVDIATEGFDVPEASCILMLRPTQSWALYTQMIGRGLRVLPNTIDGLITAEARRSAVDGSGKPDCIVIDIVDNGTKAKLEEPSKEGPRNDEPSLAAIMGLPHDFDLNGHTAVEAMTLWESLTPAHRALLFRRPTRFEDLGATLTAVDLLAELSAIEGTATVSGLAWMKVGEGVYLLPCGESSSEGDRTARLEADILGHYRLYLESGARTTETFDCCNELYRSFAMADKRIKAVWPFIGGIVSARGRWRSEPVTERQRGEMLELGVERSVVEMVETAGQAWNLIELKRRELRRV